MTRSTPAASGEEPSPGSLLLPGAVERELGPVISHFEAHGFARLGQVLSAEAVELLRRRADDLMLARAVYPGMFFQMDAPTGRYEDAPIGLGWQGPSLDYRKLEKLELEPAFRAFLRNPLFERVARARIDGPVVAYRAIIFNKGPAGGSDIPWHQDAGKLWGLSENPELQIWTALDDAPADGGCLEFVPGTHRLGLASPLGGVVPADRVAAERASERVVAVPVQAGEALLVHNLLWHRSGRGRVGGRRRGFSVCYMSAAVRGLRKKGKPREFFRVFP